MDYSVTRKNTAYFMFQSPKYWTKYIITDINFYLYGKYRPKSEAYFAQLLNMCYEKKDTGIIV